MRRAFLVALAAASLLHVRDSRVAAQGTDTLTFFKNHFVTGDFVAKGVGLRGLGVGGFATGSISIPLAGPGSVPAGADIVAAYLYFQVVTTTGAATGSAGVKFKPAGADVAFPLEADNPATPAVDVEPFAKTLAFAGTAPCFNPGGSTGESSAVTWTYRADVLRFFEPDLGGTPATNQNYGKLLVNGTHQVTVPDSGPNGNNSPMALGASLVIIYRVPSMPLSAIVLYDDGVSLNNSQRTLHQRIEGFYQAAATPNARIAYIAGSGQIDKNDYLIPPGGTIQNNVFNSSESPSWDTLLYGGTQLAVAPNSSFVDTTVSNDVSGGGGRDCITLAAMVFKTDVQDTDGDGLVDIWETVGAENGPAQLPDPKGQFLPALGAMGANPYKKDLFVEIGYMGVNAQVDTNVPPDGVLDSVRYGTDVRPPHSHLPGPEALKLVGDAFQAAPVPNVYGPIDNGPGIAVHFDVGPNYAAGEAAPYIIPNGLARGGTRAGEPVDEMVTVCQPSTGAPAWECQFSGYPGTVGWKSGYRFLRDQVLAQSTTTANVTQPATFDEELCDTTVNGTKYNCERRFDSNRIHSFRYALFAHGLGLPVSELPCLSGTTPVGANASDVCSGTVGNPPVTITGPNPAFHTPRTNTGVGDFIGADMLFTLGAFLDLDNLTPTGTLFQQAATMMHEMGHTMARRHGGDEGLPNCSPQYFSVMNYTYQLRGLVSTLAGPTLGLPQIDFSRGPQAAISEVGLTDGGSGVDADDAPYSLGWYAPVAGPLAARPGVKAAKRHCDGSIRGLNENYVRVESATVGAIDWNQDGDVGDTHSWMDINFDGVQQSGSASLIGVNDWDALALNQIGSRRNVGGLFIDPSTGKFMVGPLSGDVGKGDLGKGDLGKGDLGKGDLGKGDLGKGDLGKGDLGKGDLGKGDLGKGDLGGGDFFGDQGEIDETLANDLIRVPPYAVGACQINGTTCVSNDPSASQNYVRINWTAPSVGGIVRYTIYRALQNASGQPGTFEQAGIRTVQDGQANRQFEWIDLNSHRLVQGNTYHYYVTATYSVKNPDPPFGMMELESVNSTPDALVTITNSPPTIAHSIAPQSIFTNSSTAALSFTVGDVETLARMAAPPNDLIGAPPTNLFVGATATSATTGLAAALSFTFGPGGPSSTSTTRTVIVTHTGTVTGTATVTLWVQDTQCPHTTPQTPCPTGTTLSTTFTVTVNPRTVANLVGIQNVPPATVKSVKAGSTLPMVWQYGSPAVDTRLVGQRVTVSHGGTQDAVYSCTNTATNPCTDPGSSFFRYDTTSRRWSFNLQTKTASGVNYAPGTYSVTITPLAAGYAGTTFSVSVTR